MGGATSKPAFSALPVAAPAAPTSVTAHLAVEGGSRIAYTVLECTSNSSGSTGWTFVLSPSLGDIKEEYRLLAPRLWQDGKARVVVADLRGMGESDASFSSYTVEDTGKDIVKLVLHLGLDPARTVIVGNSMSAASCVYAAAELEGCGGLVLISAFAWDHSMPFGIETLLACCLAPSCCIAPGFWTSYYESLYTNQQAAPTADLAAHIRALRLNLQEPGRARALYSHVFAKKKVCADRIPQVVSKGVPTLALYGERDPDFGPRLAAEVEEMERRFKGVLKSPPLVIPGAGHYPMVEASEACAGAILAAWV